jgi:hypothetical protein
MPKLQEIGCMCECARSLQGTTGNLLTPTHPTIGHYLCDRVTMTMNNPCRCLISFLLLMACCSNSVQALSSQKDGVVMDAASTQENAVAEASSLSFQANNEEALMGATEEQPQQRRQLFWSLVFLGTSAAISSELCCAFGW